MSRSEPERLRRGLMAQAVIGPEERTALFRWSRWLQVADIVYNLFEMGAAILFGLAAGSIALIGFGLDSGIEVSAAAIILWRLRVEGQDEAESRTERRGGGARGGALWGCAGPLF